jgi:hypothetical protein
MSVGSSEQEYAGLLASIGTFAQEIGELATGQGAAVFIQRNPNALTRRRQEPGRLVGFALLGCRQAAFRQFTNFKETQPARAPDLFQAAAIPQHNGALFRLSQTSDGKDADAHGPAGSNFSSRT